MDYENKIQLLEDKIQSLEDELLTTKEHLKKYTAPSRSKTYYNNHKDELLEKMKSNKISAEKRKEYNKKYYLKKTEINNSENILK